MIENQGLFEQIFSMDILGDIAKEIGNCIADYESHGGVSVSEIAEIAERSIEAIAKGSFNDFNCYPSLQQDNKCHELALFVSLQSPLYAKGDHHLSYSDALKELVQHVQGRCVCNTKYVLFITDSWDAVAYADWRENIKKIGDDVRLKVCLLVEGMVVSIKI